MFAAGVRCHHRWICCGLVVADWKPWAVRGFLLPGTQGKTGMRVSASFRAAEGRS